MSSNNAIDDLDMLFDEISTLRLAEIKASLSSQKEPQTPSISSASEISTHRDTLCPRPTPHDNPSDVHGVFQRVGDLTRQLHNALHELGYDTQIETAVHTLPNTRARLSDIADITKQAAERALSAVEIGHQSLGQLQQQHAKLAAAWDKLFSKQLSVEEFKQLAHDTHTHFKHAQQPIDVAHSQFTEIMMAQSFQDLTGQVLQKIGALTQDLEQQLVQLLIDTTPPERRHHVDQRWVNGAAIASVENKHSIPDQTQVDVLLANLGF